MTKPRFLDNQEFICVPCAEDREWTMDEDHEATWHVGECAVCGEVKEITQVRDFKK